MPPGARPAAGPSSRRPAPSAGRDPYADPYTTGFEEDEGAWLLEPRAAGRPGAAAPDPLDPDAWDYDFLLESAEPVGAREEVEIDAWEAERPAPRKRGAPAPRGRGSGVPRVGLPSLAIGLPSVRMPAASSGSDLLGDRLAVGLLGANLLGVLLMAMVLAVAGGRMPEAFPVHLDAAGVADRWGSARILWRIPLLTLAIALVNAVLAWWFAPRDRFASRFLLGAALFVHLIAWIALFDFI